MRVTIHGKDRIQERVGGKKKNAEKIAEKAFHLGISHSEARGRLHKYLTKLYFQNPENNKDMRIYNRKVYIFCGEVLITVLPLPHNLCELADIQQKKKQEKNVHEGLEAGAAAIEQSETDQDLDTLKAFVLACRMLSNIAGCPATIGVVEWAGWPECNGEIDECGDYDLWECWQKYFRERVEDEQVCRICGCTQENACPRGCFWVEEDLCSRCAVIVKGEDQC